MFGEKVNRLFALLEITAADCARIAHCDKSHISRMASGARVPKNGGAAAWRLVEGIYLWAEKKERVDALCRAIGCENKSSAAGIRAQLMVWLYDGEEPAAGRMKRPKEKAPYRAFGERLGAVMELAGVSNIRLSRALSIDPSYISRFCSGLRSPKANPKLMNDICVFLLGRLDEQGKLDRLSGLIGMSAEALSDREQALESLYVWLYHTEKTDSKPFVEGLIDQIESFSGDIKAPPLSFEEAADSEILAEEAQTYYGAAGLQRAVLRFLGNVVLRWERELLLYSDQSMEWMVSDPAFRAKWATLMALCVTGGVKITIIHNVNRNLPEMADAIKSWLPLYPSGMIQPYYCRSRVGERFSATRFICPGYACISGCNVIGAENKTGMYRFDTDPRQLEAHEAAFRALLDRSGQLAQVHSTEETGRLGDPDVNALSVLCSTLSLASMPEDTLLSALGRAGADDALKERIRRIQIQQLAVLERDAKTGYLHEYVPLSSDDALFGGAVPMDIPGLALAYTPEEYAAHIRNILSLSDRLMGYRVIPLPEPLFADIKVIISDRAVAITRLKPPYFTVQFEHPDLCRAFAAYAGRIGAQYRQDRLTTKQMLERYLSA